MLMSKKQIRRNFKNQFGQKSMCKIGAEEDVLAAEISAIKEKSKTSQGSR